MMGVNNDKEVCNFLGIMMERGRHERTYQHVIVFFGQLIGVSVVKNEKKKPVNDGVNYAKVFCNDLDIIMEVGDTNVLISI